MSGKISIIIVMLVFIYFYCSQEQKITHIELEKSPVGIALEIKNRSDNLSNYANKKAIDFDTVYLNVSAEDMDNISQVLRFNSDSSANTMVEVPAGLDRLFVISAEDLISNQIYAGSTLVDLTEGKDTSLVIRLSISEEDSSHNFGSFTDPRDGYTYKTIQIGDQVWMAENLAYDIGDSCCAYELDESNVLIYGRLYHWEAAILAAPEGWHLPTDEEWKELEIYLGMNQNEADNLGTRGSVEGSKLKSTSGWYENGNGTNESGFSALPGGCREYGGSFYGKTTNAYFWTASEKDLTLAWNRLLYYGYDSVHRDDNTKDYWFSVRCVRDE